jgi:hypothetical protein
MPALGSGLLAIAIERYLDPERNLASIPSAFKELLSRGLKMIRNSLCS